jgi:demethylmenaquinone methyltransferase / 2-methoxy-6-polyprenyl-1,4-benzoquinol methylase
MEPDLKNRLNSWTDQERILAVKKIFNTITPRYDLLNRIMSARQDVRWRRFTVSKLPKHVKHVLDVATGTGDLAIDLARLRPDLTVCGVDFVESMMRYAIEKTQSANLTNRINYVAGDALHLPFGDAEFDAITIAFGLRNIPDRLSAIKEMARVIKPGGKLFILEMTFPRNLRLKKFFTWYLNTIIPILGSVLSGNKAAYTYLPDSIQDFLHPDELTDLFNRAAIKFEHAYPLMFGLTYLHEATIP